MAPLKALFDKKGVMTMFDPKERITYSISTAELERRWALAREVMRERKLDYLLMRGDEEFLGGYVRWFTDLPARHSYPYTVIFPKDDEMTLIYVGPFAPRTLPRRPGPSAASRRGSAPPISPPPTTPTPTMRSWRSASSGKRRTR